MAYLAAPLARLVEQLERLPSVGHKSAQRLAFHILNMPDKSAEALVASIQEARAQIISTTMRSARSAAPITATGR